MSVARIRKRLEALEEKNGSMIEQLQHEKAVAEVEAWYAECCRRFNSPEARQEREEWYRELQRQGEQRKKEFYERIGEKI